MSRLNRAWLMACSTFLSMCVVAGFAATPASAHILKVDGTITGVLHVNPDDQPISGVPTTYLLFMDDSTNKFSLPACDCNVTVKENGKTIVTQPLTLNSQSVPGGTVTFPRADVYEFIVSGTPKQAGAFQPFTLTYLERVTQGPGNSPPSVASLFTLGLAGVAVVVALVACWFEARSQIRYSRRQG